MIRRAISTILPLLALIASPDALSQPAAKAQLDPSKANCEAHRKAADGKARSGPEVDKDVADCKQYVAALRKCHAMKTDTEKGACIDAYNASLKTPNALPDKPGETMK